MKIRQTSAAGLIISKRLRIDGITIYKRGKQVIGRTSLSMEKRSNTLPQFIQRQKMRHTIALWKQLKYCKPMFTRRGNAFQNFASLANQLPAVYVIRISMDNSSFLMPGIPVSDGILPTVQQELGSIEGTPALITNLKYGNRHFNERLCLFTAVQEPNQNMPLTLFRKRDVLWQEMTVTDGFYALKGEEFADDMKGWALVLIKDNDCSPQTIVTRCTFFQKYTTDEALNTAAKSYGGLTRSRFE